MSSCLILSPYTTPFTAKPLKLQQPSLATRKYCFKPTIESSKMIFRTNRRGFENNFSSKFEASHPKNSTWNIFVLSIIIFWRIIDALRNTIGTVVLECSCSEIVDLHIDFLIIWDRICWRGGKGDWGEIMYKLSNKIIWQGCKTYK